MFCYAVQFAPWWLHTRYQPNDMVVSSGEMEVYRVHQTPLFYICEMRNYMQDLLLMRLR